MRYRCSRSALRCHSSKAARTSAAAGAISVLRALTRRGYGIVLAHPERTPMLQRDDALVSELVRSGVLCCLDARSLTDAAERPARATAWRLLRAGLAHVIASDSHDVVTMHRPESRSRGSPLLRS